VLSELKVKPVVPGPLQVPESQEERDFAKLEGIANKLRGTLKADLLDEKLEKIEEMQVRDLKEKLPQMGGVGAIVFDGVVTQELADVAAERGLKYLVGMRARVERSPANLKVLTIDELRQLHRTQGHRS